MRKFRSLTEILEPQYPLLSISQSLREISLEVLRYLLLHGPSTKYEVEKDTLKSHGSIHNSFKILVEKGLIEVKTSETWRTGLQRKLYGITLTGLMYTYPKTRDTKLNQVYHGKTLIERYTYLLPLILGKWHHFKEKDLEDLAESRFKHEMKIMDRNQFYENFFLENLPINAEEKEKWLNALRDDSEIKHFCIDTMKRRLVNIEDTRNIVLVVLGILRGSVHSS